MSFWALRPRVPGNIVVGAATRFKQGGPTPYVFLDVDPRSPASVFSYHEGDLFTPGAENFVWESGFELNPVQTIWGNAFLRKPNQFSPIQPPQLFANHTVTPNGIGGEQTGGLYSQRLIEPTDHGEFGGA